MIAEYGTMASLLSFLILLWISVYADQFLELAVWLHFVILVLTVIAPV